MDTCPPGPEWTAVTVNEAVRPAPRAAPIGARAASAAPTARPLIEARILLYLSRRALRLVKYTPAASGRFPGRLSEGCPLRARRTVGLCAPRRGQGGAGRAVQHSSRSLE